MQTSYVLDADDRIIAVDGMWDAFALRNHGDTALRGQVLEKPIWAFTEGYETRNFLNAVFFAVRIKGQHFETSYRCDSDTEARVFRMFVLPGLEGELRVIHMVLDIQRPQFSMPPMHMRQTITADRCSICCRYHAEETWVDAFRQASAAFKVRQYVVCPCCRTASREALERVTKARTLQAQRPLFVSQSALDETNL